MNKIYKKLRKFLRVFICPSCDFFFPYVFRTDCTGISS